MKSDIIISSVFLLMVYHNAAALPTHTRVKRVSDQRLAELETLVALSKMSGKLVTVPLGLGKVDPKYIGRRRRSDLTMLSSILTRSSQEDDGAPLQLNYAPDLLDFPLERQ